MAIKEFWNEEVTRASWEKLASLAKETEFTLIGGWAAYLWTKAHKSKDIDIVVDYDILNKLRATYHLEKNERLKKYEIKLGDFDVDIYLSHYSVLAVPVEELKGHTSIVSGIRVVSPEMLVILKQGAEIARRGTIKGRKDLIDIITIILLSPFSIEKYLELTKKFGLKNFENELLNEIKLFDTTDLIYIGMNLNEFAKWKRAFIEKLKK